MQEPEKISVLESIVKRPGMYWGNSANHFHSFIAFVSGVECFNHPETDPIYQRELANIIPPHFTEFVYAELGGPDPGSGMHWSYLIQRRTKDGREALDLFYELRKKYDQSKWAEKARETKQAEDS